MSPVSVSPLPTDEEAVAIAVALQFAWPVTQYVAEVIEPDAPGAWRFSGRWWNGPLPVRRQRP